MGDVRVDFLGPPHGSTPAAVSTLSIVQIIFSVWSFEISEDILRNKKIIIGLYTFSNQDLIYLGPIWIILVFVLTTLLKVAKLQ